MEVWAREDARPLRRTMTANCVITGGLPVAALGGLALWFAVEHQAHLRLAEEHRGLEQQLNRMAGLMARNAELSNALVQARSSPPVPQEDARELLRLRGEAGVLRQQCRELEAARNDNHQAHAAFARRTQGQASATAAAGATADYWPRDSWTYPGFSSPDAALQSCIWAANNGDVKVLLAGATGDVRNSMDNDFAGKPGEEASIRAMDEVMGLKSVRVLSREPQGNDTVVLAAEFEDRNETHTSKLLIKKVGNEWKLSGVVQ
jgi:hypothetical protein